MSVETWQTPGEKEINDRYAIGDTRVTLTTERLFNGKLYHIVVLCSHRGSASFGLVDGLEEHARAQAGSIARTLGQELVPHRDRRDDSPTFGKNFPDIIAK